ncbi:hypothetical protein ACOMHN_014946 [Nucella lapillus]
MLLPGHSEEFLVFPEDSDTPVIVTVHGQKKQSMLGNTTNPLAACPQLYEGIKLDYTLDSMPDNPAEVDKDDPDTDVQSTDEDDDDDDDDDDSSSSW